MKLAIPRFITDGVIDARPAEQKYEAGGKVTWGNSTMTLLRTGVRKIDVAARVGGEEFAVILPGATRATALELAERLRRTVADTPAVHEGRSIRFTVSIGIAAMDRDDVQASTVLVRADAALYRAKQGGRDRVETAA